MSDLATHRYLALKRSGKRLIEQTIREITAALVGVRPASIAHYRPDKSGLNEARSVVIIRLRYTEMKKLNALRKVCIEAGGSRVVCWEAKDPALRGLGRWTDPKALLQRIYELEHPEAVVAEGPGRQWQATWRGRFSPPARSKPRKAA